MKRQTYKLSHFFNGIAGFTFVAVMVLITCNTVTRLFGYPLKGTVEIVGFLSAIAIGLSLAHCAAQGGHIAITLFVDRMPAGLRKYINLIVDTVVFLFLGFIVIRLWIYAISMRTTGQIALTTGIPFYPFVIIIDFGFLIYALVILGRIVDSLMKGGEK